MLSIRGVPGNRGASFLCAMRRASRNPRAFARFNHAQPQLVALSGVTTMLVTIAIILLVLWALGFFAFHVAGGLIHVLLVVALIVFVVNLIRGRSAV